MTYPRSLQLSNANIYHVFVRGMGRQLLFEDETDHEFFLRILARSCSKREAEIFAWVLMGNHVHLIVHASQSELSSLMKSVEGSYAQYFNRRYDRVGSLFQGRFGSQPIHDDTQLLCAIRYIHANPIQAGISEKYDYKWSSYQEYMPDKNTNLTTRLCNTEFVLRIIGGTKRFKEFHRHKTRENEFLDEDAPRGRTVPLSDDIALAIAKEELGKGWQNSLRDLPRKERNSQLSRLRSLGLSIRQIERLSGLGRGIISRACAK